MPPIATSHRNEQHEVSPVAIISTSHNHTSKKTNSNLFYEIFNGIMSYLTKPKNDAKQPEDDCDKTTTLTDTNICSDNDDDEIVEFKRAMVTEEREEEIEFMFGCENDAKTQVVAATTDDDSTKTRLSIVPKSNSVSVKLR